MEAKNSLSNFSLSNASSSSLPAGDGETDGEAPVDSDGDGTVAGCRKNNHGRRFGNQAVCVEDDWSSFPPPAETAAFPPAEGSPRVPLGVDGLTTPRDHDWNESAAARPPSAFFRRFGERTEPSPTTSDVCWKSDVEAEVDTPGADVAAEVGDKDGEVEHERVADISPTRADVIHDASRADVIHDARAEVIHDSRADVIHDARADVIHPRADITNSMGEKNSNLGKKSTPVPLFIGNIPLHTGSNGIANDKIADAFNNSSRKNAIFHRPNEAKWGGCSSSFT
ncbi:UNVERIFIED_CONTAM: hypothetical protein Sindi_2646600 [Sesamum indicum]